MQRRDWPLRNVFGAGCLIESLDLVQDSIYRAENPDWLADILVERHFVVWC